MAANRITLPGYRCVRRSGTDGGSMSSSAPVLIGRPLISCVGERVLPITVGAAREVFERVRRAG
jgi:hypothetical protein